MDYSHTSPQKALQDGENERDKTAAKPKKNPLLYQQFQLEQRKRKSIVRVAAALAVEGKNFVVAGLPAVVGSAASWIVNGPTHQKWSLPYHLTVNTIRECFANLQELDHPNVFGFQFRTSLPALMPLDGQVRKDSYMVNEAVVDHIKQTAPGDEWPKEADDIYHIVHGEWVWAPGHATSDTVVYLLHGGAYIVGSAPMYRQFTYNYSRDADARVFATNYRLAPQNPYPCALIDAVSGYLYLLETCEAKNICLIGDSAGGGLLLATLLVLRDMGKPLPAGGICLSPWVDLTHSCPSFLGNGHLDYLPPLKDSRLGDRLHYYASNDSLTLPYVSPFWARDLGGLPPILIQVGERWVPRANGSEKLHDEIVEFAEMAASTPNNAPVITLEVYEPARTKDQVWSNTAKYYVVGPVLASIRLVLLAIVAVVLASLDSVLRPLPLVVSLLPLRMLWLVMGRILLFLAGFYSITSVQVDIKKTRGARERKELQAKLSKTPGKSTRLIVTNHTSYIDVLYFAYRYAPLFLLVTLDGKVVPASPLQALVRSGSNPALDPAAVSLEEFLDGYTDSVPLVIFPEATTSNGRGLLQFMVQFARVPSHVQLEVIGLRYTWDNFCPCYTTGSLRMHCWTLLQQYSNSLDVRRVSQHDIEEIAGEAKGDPQAFTLQLSTLLATALRLRRVGKNAKDKAEFLEYFEERESRSYKLK
ncbi:hypothetical protein HDU91_001448 [Kappamyces sp. JEL0680]|nr:hypothetical protein HDU91_001448 [Kappamyces sp. JEL0680]